MPSLSSLPSFLTVPNFDALQSTRFLDHLTGNILLIKAAAILAIASVVAAAPTDISSSDMVNLFPPSWRTETKSYITPLAFLQSICTVA
jgi:hypothetical protein